MPEIIQKVRPVMLNYACDDCCKKPNPGCILKRTGNQFLTYPVTYEYKCPSCYKIYMLKDAYPSIDYEKEDENF